jgi:hypothetical protein
MSNFDPDVVGDELAARLKEIKQAEADAWAAFEKATAERDAAQIEAKGAIIERKKAVGNLLIEILKSHPEHVKFICKRAGLKQSRMYQLIEIVTGKKTIKESRDENKAAVQKHRAAKKKGKSAIPLHPPVMEDLARSLKGPQEPVETAHVDPDASTAAPTAHHAEAQTVEPVPKGDVTAQRSKSAGEPEPDPMPSEKATSECKRSIDIQFPQMSAMDRTTLLAYARALNVKLHAKETPRAKTA